PSAYAALAPSYRLRAKRLLAPHFCAIARSWRDELARLPPAHRNARPLLPDPIPAHLRRLTPARCSGDFTSPSLLFVFYALYHCNSIYNGGSGGSLLNEGGRWTNSTGGDGSGKPPGMPPSHDAGPSIGPRGAG